MSQTYEPARDAAARRGGSREPGTGPRGGPARPGGDPPQGATARGLDAVNPARASGPAHAANGLPLQAVDTGALRPVRPGSPSAASASSSAAASVHAAETTTIDLSDLSELLGSGGAGDRPDLADDPYAPRGAHADVPADEHVTDAPDAYALGPAEVTADLLTADRAEESVVVMSLVGGPASAPSRRGVHTGDLRPREHRGERLTRRDVRTHRPPTAQAGGQDGDGRDDRQARRGRSGSGPAAGRLTGNKVTAGPSSGGRGDRGADRGRGGRRFLPGGGDGLPDTGSLPADVPGPPTGHPVLPHELTHDLPAVPSDPGTGPVQQLPQPPTGSVPAWLAEEPASFAAAFAGDALTDTSTATLRPFVDDDPPADAGSAPSLVRPYSRTGGRTKPGHELDLEALVVTTVNGREAWSSPLLSPEHVQVIGMCVDTTSVAEIAARLTVPIGVARVIIADMVDLGLVEVMKTSANFGDERDPAFLRRVLSGLQRL